MPMIDYVCAACGYRAEEYHHSDPPLAIPCPRQLDSGPCGAQASRASSFPGQYRPTSAKRFDAIVVWESTAEPGKYSFPGDAREAVPDGYRKVELTNMQEADRFVSRFNESERSRLEDERHAEREYFDRRIKQRREDTMARLKNNPRAVAMLKAVQKYRDAARNRKYARKIDPNFHIQALSFDSGNRQGYSSEETGWRERKA